MERRTFNTPIREPWNPKIHNILKAIDLHTEIYLQTKDKFHDDSAKLLRSYVHSLKTWILSEEDEKKVID
jgi:hypothetical protein